MSDSLFSFSTFIRPRAWLFLGLYFSMSSLWGQSGQFTLSAAATDGSQPPSSFSLSMRVGASQTLSATASSSESIALSGSILPAAPDVGLSADLFVVIATGDAFYMQNAGGGFDSWDGNPANLAPARGGVTLESEQNLEIFSGVLGLTARLDIYLAYRKTGSDVLVYSATPGTFTISTEAQVGSVFYAPAPIADVLELTRPVSWSEINTEASDLLRFSFGPAESDDVLRIAQTGNQIESALLLESGLAAQTDISEQMQLRSLFQFLEEEGGGYRIHSVMHSNYALDWNSSTGELVLRDIRSGSFEQSTAAYLLFELSGSAPARLVAVGRKQYDSGSAGFIVESAWEQRELHVVDAQLTLQASSGTDLTLYAAGVDLSIPFDFNPQGNSRVGNPEVTPEVKLVNDSVASTPQQVTSEYSDQVVEAGVSSLTSNAAAIMLDTIEQSLLNEGAQLRYPKDFYLAFREGMLSRVLTASDSTDGVVGQNTVPYVYFTNATDSEGEHHPFMVIAGYGIPDAMALLWDVPRPPGDGLTGSYEDQAVTRSYHREAYLTKIPLRDYGRVSSLGENTMVNDLASDVGQTTFDHHSYASVSATGIAVDGVVIYPSFNNRLQFAQQDAELSAQGMHSGRGLGVHYHADAHSGTGAGLHLYNARDYVGREHPPVISMGFDGVAGYGIYQAGDESSAGATIPLDEFGGHEHGVYGYHYHSFTAESVTQGNGGGAGVSYTSHKLPPLGAWAGRINDIPDFWQGPAPDYVGGKSVFLGNE